MNYIESLSVIDLVIKSEHMCNRDVGDDVRIIYCRSLTDNVEKWILTKTWIAGEEELLDGEAEYIGEVIQFSTVLIRYCPFCGQKLPDAIASG